MQYCFDLLDGFCDLVGDSFESDGEVDLLDKVSDLIDDVSSSVFNK